MVVPFYQRPEVAHRRAVEWIAERLRPLIEETVSGHVQVALAPKQGNLNYCFLVKPAAGTAPRWILRVKDEAEPEHCSPGPCAATFWKEQAVQRLLAEHQIPAAQPVGPVWIVAETFQSRGPFAASLQTRLEGRNGHEIAAHGSSGELELLREVGRLARPLKEITFPAYGHLLNSEEGRFEQNWGEYLEEIFGAELRSAPEVLPHDCCMSLNRLTESLGRLDKTPQLVHADLHASNVLFNESGQAKYLLDWERSRAAIVEEELARVLYENFVLGQRFKRRGDIRAMLLGDGVTPQLAAFLSGYGLSLSEYSMGWRSTVESLLLLLCVHFFVRYELEWKRTRPDWQAPADYTREVIDTITERLG